MCQMPPRPRGGSSARRLRGRDRGSWWPPAPPGCSPPPPAPPCRAAFASEWTRTGRSNWPDLIRSTSWRHTVCTASFKTAWLRGRVDVLLVIENRSVRAQQASQQTHDALAQPHTARERAALPPRRPAATLEGAHRRSAMSSKNAKDAQTGGLIQRLRCEPNWRRSSGSESGRCRGSQILPNERLDLTHKSRTSFGTAAPCRSSSPGMALGCSRKSRARIAPCCRAHPRTLLQDRKF